MRGKYILQKEKCVFHVVNLAESRITGETDHLACLLGSVLIMVIEVGRRVHCTRHHFLTGILDCVNGGRQLSSCMHSLFLMMHAM